METLKNIADLNKIAEKNKNDIEFVLMLYLIMENKTLGDLMADDNFWYKYQLSYEIPNEALTNH